jgi:hypothetical protein
MQDQQRTPGDQITVRGTFNFLHLLINGHATCFTPFLHDGFGCEALGVNGVAAFVIILLYMNYTGSAMMLNFLVVWLVAMLMQRVKSVSLRRQGHVIHSRYHGRSILAKLFKNEAFAQRVEPLACLFAGIALTQLDDALAVFVMSGFVSLMLKQGIEQRIDDMTLQRMHDAEIEQRFMIQRKNDRFRNY